MAAEQSNKQTPNTAASHRPRPILRGKNDEQCMIMEAIEALNQANGSNVSTISDQILATYGLAWIHFKLRKKPEVETAAVNGGGAVTLVPVEC